MEIVAIIYYNGVSIKEMKDCRVEGGDSNFTDSDR